MAPVVNRFLPGLLFVLAVLVPAHAQDAAVTEESVKAAFLYKFPGFVEWPAPHLERAEDPVIVGVAGGADVFVELSLIAQGRKSGRPLQLRRVQDPSNVAGLHMLFIGARERARAPELIRSAQQQGVLTVTEWEGALRLGSVINFVTTDGRVRFEISLEPAERSKLRLSSRLLAVAQQVHSTRP
jgi:hypothetical protein